jgi:spermidine/putrescine transport system substrate-binding protein
MSHGGARHRGELTRRRFLQGTGLAGAAAFLAACGGADRPASSGSPTPVAVPPSSGIPASSAPSGEASATPTGLLRFANWLAYIDVGPDGVTSPTIAEFEREFDVTVDYVNGAIEDDASFLAKIRPDLESGAATGWDLIVLSDWMAARVIAAGWVEELDPASVRTALANVRDELKGRSWDPDMTYHFPWQSSAIGVGYNRASTGRELMAVADLFDPAFEGKVTLLPKARDTFPLIHLALQAQGRASANPVEAMTVADARVVHDFLKPFVDSGHIRGFRGNDYLTDFGSGETWAAIVQSGDLASSAGPDDVFVFPDEGSIIWSHDLLIPRGAANKTTAELMIDWVYDPDRAARLANWIHYISPVKGASGAIGALDPNAATDPLLFPPPEVLARQHPQPTFSETDEASIEALFADLTNP